MTLTAFGRNTHDVRKTTLLVDDEKLAAARVILGTNGISDTIDGALDDVLRRAAIARTLEDLSTIDRGLVERAWR